MQFRWLVTIVTILFLLSILPIYPSGKLLIDDPLNDSDARVSANLSANELVDIVSVVRKPRWGGLYELILTRGYAFTIISIMEDEGGVILEKSDSSELSNVEIAPKGDILLFTGRPSSNAHQSGNKYVLKNFSGDWVITEKSNWME